MNMQDYNSGHLEEQYIPVLCDARTPEGVGRMLDLLAGFYPNAGLYIIDEDQDFFFVALFPGFRGEEAA